MSIEEMKNVDVRTVKREELTDIREVEVNKRKSREGQVKDYLRQIKNPYCYRYGEYVVKIGFEDTTVTLTDRLQELIMKLPAASCGVSARDSLRSSLVCCAASCGELNPLWD